MRKGDDGEEKRKREKKRGGKKKKKKMKITVEIVATNVVASRPPNGNQLQRRPFVPAARTTCKTQNCIQEGSKWPTGPGKRRSPRLLGAQSNFC